MKVIDLRNACEPLDVNIVSGDITIDEVGIKNASDTRINPATEEKQDTLNALITTIDTVLDAMLVCCNNIDGNTDGIEALITASNTKLDTIITNSGATATEATLAAAKAVLDNLLTCCQAIDANTDGLEALITATNSKLDQFSFQDGNLKVQVETSVLADNVFSWAGEVNMDSSGDDNPLVIIRNPTGSGKQLKLDTIYGGVAISNNWTLLKIWHGPTITAIGISQTPLNNLLGSSTTSVMEIYTLPTITSEGTQLRSLFNAENNNSIKFVENRSIVLQAGEDILITGDPKSNNRVLSFTAIWSEE